MAVYPNDMPDSTKELLNAHHAAILRELDRNHTTIAANLGEIKSDMIGIRVRMDEHNDSDNTRFSTITNQLGILGWAYGVGVAILGALFALFKMGKLE